LAQHNIDPRALVYCEAREDSSQNWTLEIPEQEPLGLGDNFGHANRAIYALVRAGKARSAAK
jgi:hypothetical protein